MTDTGNLEDTLPRDTLADDSFIDITNDESLGRTVLVDTLFFLPVEVNAERVDLCGDFSEWRPISMSRTDMGFEVRVQLAVGSTHEYKFLLDGERWEDAWDAEEYVANPFGTTNSVVHVETQMG